MRAFSQQGILNEFIVKMNCKFYPNKWNTDFWSNFFKCDLAKENLTNNNEQMNEFCRDKGFAGWYETSAKDDINVETAAKFLVTKVSDKLTISIN